MGAGVVDPLLIGTDHLMYQTSYHLSRGQLSLPFLDWLMAYLSIANLGSEFANHVSIDFYYKEDDVPCSLGKSR